MLFSEIPGLLETKQLLINSVKSNHVAHGLLFDGKSGSAALPMALAFATYINCQKPSETDACGECPSCQKISKLAHPDFIYAYPTAGGKKVLSENFIKEWREFIRQTPYGGISEWLEFIEIKQGNIPVEESRQIVQNLSLKSYEGGYKIVLIWMVEAMGQSAANALLKILEEPPEKTIFILITNNIHRLLTTIISRTQRIAIRDLSDEELIPYLINIKGVTAERAPKIAYLSEGNINKALDILDKKDQNEKDWFANWMRYCYAFDLSKLIPLADEFDALTKESQRSLLDYGLKIIREIYLKCISADNLIKLEGEELQFVQKFSKVFKFENIGQITEQISDAQMLIERNVRAKIVFLDISMQICRLIK
ncbi:DNA polymerase III subunit delta' [Lacihabitans sp. LS3-19]|uniref:DNA polymerase III subunit delta' n=1 Tax=Lacihabitans sp. LS3-19 TaxID=2487335 RepID=UPI0020CED85B|nr:DNA polymerase III subunit delta' [Lacihabitans sp. LS3-19]MCP9769029.1 DNA polymerase III subunit delta' [Lacihabitans sp. LS3-19]